MIILINSCYGSFGFSEAFLYHMKAIHGLEPWNVNRENPFVIDEAIKFGLKNAGDYASKLETYEIPDGCLYEITEHGGWESVITYIEVTEDQLRNGLCEEYIQMVLSGCQMRLKVDPNQYALQA